MVLFSDFGLWRWRFGHSFLQQQEVLSGRFGCRYGRAVSVIRQVI
jgi:hypothetical protein